MARLPGGSRRRRGRHPRLPSPRSGAAALLKDTTRRAGTGTGGAAPGFAALGDGLGILQRPLAGQGEGHDRIAAEADDGGLLVDADALRPALRGVAARGGPDKEAQPEAAAPVALAAGGLDGPAECGGEHVGSFHGGFHYSFLCSRMSRRSVPP